MHVYKTIGFVKVLGFVSTIALGMFVHQGCGPVMAQETNHSNTEVQVKIPGKPSMLKLNEEERLRGFVFKDDVTWFIFDAALYSIEPSQVVVTGEFRNWSQDMDDPDWMLSRPEPTSTIWKLAVPNADALKIGPSTEFKFRADDGKWIDPHPLAPNREGGNLVHLPGVEPIRLSAEIFRDGTIVLSLKGKELANPLDINTYRLTNAKGQTFAIESVTPIDDSSWRITPSESIDAKRVYYITVASLNLRTLCRRDGWMREIDSTKTLGSEISQDGKSTTWRLFAPRADAIRLYLYDEADDEKPSQTHPLQCDNDGVWEVTLSGDFHGIYYDYTVHGPEDPGNYFFETHPVHISDPYSRVSVDSFGKSRVWKATVPAKPLNAGRPKMQDVIAYEVHVEDFTNQLPVSDDLKGTLPAMVMPGLRNSRGESIGFDYLIDLGINVVHLMPVQEFLHYPDDVWQATFADDPYMIAGGVNLSSYEWGYRTTHSFAVETRYRQRGTEHGAQRDQFRDLVQAFHDRDIAVIIDIVPNHTGENMDERHHLFGFNVLDLPYFHRTNDSVEHIGPYGNEIKTEDRPMVQRWLIDQCKHFIDEFGIDGFRIDLAGQIDKQTLTRLRKELGPDVIIYGEPWIAISDPVVAKNPLYGWYKKDSPITFFQDDARNALKGPTSNPKNKLTDRGFAGGNASQRENACHAIANTFPDEANPNSGINYLDIHDNWALADQFARQKWDGRQGVDEPQYKIAAGMLLTSLGPVVIHGGTEMMRSKGAATLGEVVKHLPDGPLLFHGKSDTYNLRKPNEFVWENVGIRSTDPQSTHGYAEMVAWWKGLIELRQSEYGRVFRIGDRPSDDYIEWLLPEDPHLLGYIVQETVMVLINTSQSEAAIANIQIPPGRWRLVANESQVDMRRGVEGTDKFVEGNQTESLTVPGTSLKIWVCDK
jgi:pullulanase